MLIKTYMNGREVHNPAARTLIVALAMLIVAIALSILFFVILPLAGLAIGAGLAAGLIGGGSALLGVTVRRRLQSNRRRIDMVGEQPRHDHFLNR